MKLFLVLLGTLLIAGTSSAEGIYRWVDKSGAVHYGDRPADDAKQVVQKDFADQPVDDAGLSYEVRRAKAKYPVVLYLTSDCGKVCADARALLDKRGIPYTQKLLATSDDMESFRAQSGGEVVPTLSVGKSWVKGFQAAIWNNELDLAGYPKTAPYQPNAQEPPAFSAPQEMSPEEEPAPEE